MEEGLYKVTFKTPLGQGTGVVSLRAGRVEGGDTMMYYVGSYKIEGSQFNAQIRTKTHSQISGFTPVLGAGDAALNLTGTFNGSSGHTTGTSPQAPGLAFEALLTKLAD